MLKKWATYAVVLGGVLSSAVPAMAQEAGFQVPEELQASAIQTATMAVVGPAIAVLIGLGAAFTIAWCVYKVLMRKVTRFARG